MPTPTQYSNSRALARKANAGVNAPRVNTTQRSWSDYEGSRPINSWVGKGPVGNARFYGDSSVYGPGAEVSRPVPGAAAPAATEAAPTESSWDRLQREAREREAARRSEQSEWERLNPLRGARSKIMGDVKAVPTA